MQTDKTELIVNANLAKAYLLNNETQSAKNIYRKHRKTKIGLKQLKNLFISDLEEIKKTDFSPKLISEVEKILQK